jgi:hypothetical protein
VFYRRIRVATLGNQRIKKSFFYSQKEAYQIRFSAATNNVIKTTISICLYSFLLALLIPYPKGLVLAIFQKVSSAAMLFLS